MHRSRLRHQVSRARGSYHTIIFAPDTLGDDGPTVQLREGSYAGLGTQTTLPVADPEPVLFDAAGRGIYFENPRPASRPIGFRART